MRYCFEDSLDINILNGKTNQRTNSIGTWSSQKTEFLSRITSFLSPNLNAQIVYFHFQVFHLPFMFLKSNGFNCFAKIMERSCCFVVQVILPLTLQATLITYIFQNALFII